MKYYSIEAFEKTGLVTTFMTGEGHGCWLSNDERGHKAYRELATKYGLNAEHDLVGTFQRHSCTIKHVTRAENAGQNVLWREAEPIAWDGIITNERGFMLTSIESDCTPVFMLDGVNRAIGIVHSGWKGTAGEIAKNAIIQMREEFGTRAEDVLVAFGPCICKDCYEVGEDLKPHFEKAFSTELDRLFKPKANGKFLLDVNLAIRISLERIGVRPENITDTHLCTYHETEFYSHRRQLRDGGEGKDNMLTGIMLK